MSQTMNSPLYHVQKHQKSLPRLRINRMRSKTQPNGHHLIFNFTPVKVTSVNKEDADVLQSHITYMDITSVSGSRGSGDEGRWAGGAWASRTPSCRLLPLVVVMVVIQQQLRGQLYPVQHAVTISALIGCRHQRWSAGIGRTTRTHVGQHGLRQSLSVVNWYENKRTIF